MSRIFSEIAAYQQKVTGFFMDLRYFSMGASVPAVGRSAIERELAWKSISWFKLRFYHWHDDIEQSSLQGLLKNSGLLRVRTHGLIHVDVTM